MRSKMVSVGLIAVLLLSGVSAYSQNPDDIYWDNRISPTITGIDGFVWAVTVYDGKLIVAGSFSEAGGAAANNIAAWDGMSWSALGLGIDSGAVYSLTVHNNKLIAGGFFELAGGAAAHCIAAWDGSTWSPLGAGMNGNGEITALTVFNDQLIAAGGETDMYGNSDGFIARWDGAGWADLGSELGFAVRALTIFNGQLIAGGSDFHGNPGCLAAWDGAGWSFFTVGWYSSISALEVYDGKLIIGGSNLTINDTSSVCVAAWNGSSWAVARTGSAVYTLSVYRDNLIVAGDNIAIDGASEVPVAAWDGNSWSALDSGLIGKPFADCGFTSFQDKLVFTGVTRDGWSGISAGGNLHVLEGSHWSALNREMTYYDEIRALSVYDGKLIAGGKFPAIGGIVANHLAAWNDTSWSPLGSGLNMRVNALTVLDHQLIAGGAFTKAGGIDANHVAAWDGNTWSALAQGSDFEVSALAVYNGNLIANGFVGGLASWNGESWVALPNPYGYAGVTALTVHLGKLIVASYEMVDPGLGNRLEYYFDISEWDGSSWSSLLHYRLIVTGLPAPCTSPFRDLISLNSDLVAAGCGVRVLTDGHWTTLGASDYYATALSLFNDKLVAGGSTIAYWDGNSWAPLGSGVQSTISWASASVLELTVYRHKLIVAGRFTRAGGKVAGNLAQWTKRTHTCGDADGSGEVNLVDIVYHVNWIFAGGPAPIDEAAGDCNCDCRPNIGDAVYLVNYLYLSGPAPCASCP